MPLWFVSKQKIRNCPKSLGGAYSGALWAAKKRLFGPFHPPFTGQIHARSVARTPFRTVSLGYLVNRGNPSFSSRHKPSLQSTDVT